VIAKIDDGDYTLAVESARGKAITQQATIDRIGKQVAAQQASIDQAKAQLASAEAAATRAELELARQQSLASREYASKQALEAAQANKLQTAASVQGAQAAVEAAEANVQVLKAQQEEAARTLKELNTALAKAERDLSFTLIKAPMDGVIGNRAMQVGDYVQPGQRLASLVPLDAVYVDANFKETQLAKLRPGQPVKIAVDSLGGEKIDGTVVSVAPASGSVFSLLPPDNATGNFTKIVQRVPVRIQVPGELAERGVLRPGMSVIASIDTKPGAVASVPIRTAANRTRQ
jgi:membrane fusion protein (multidrug efflux system)